MIFCKIAGALFLFLSGTLLASHLNGELARRRTQAAAIEEWLRFVRGQIDCFAMPISDILLISGRETLCECGYFADVMPNDFFEFLESAEIYDGDIEEALRELGASFGGCYREEQLRACERCIEAVSQRRQEMSAEIPKKKKLNATLCVSAALAVAILLL